jgi:hypothetical protein
MKYHRRFHPNGEEFFVDESGNEVDAAKARAHGFEEGRTAGGAARVNLTEAQRRLANGSTLRWPTSNGNLTAADLRIANENGARALRAIAVKESATIDTWKALGMTTEEATIAAGDQQKVPVRSAARNAGANKADQAKRLKESFLALGMTENEATIAAE